MTRTVRLQRRVRAEAIRPPRWRSAVALLALITFLFQGYLVQTHIHGLPQSVATSVGHQSSAPTVDSQSPVNDDQSNCLLCQEFLHAGAYVMPVALAALPPTMVVGVVEILVAPLLVDKSPTHIWMGRAPPRA